MIKLKNYSMFCLLLIFCVKPIFSQVEKLQDVETLNQEQNNIILIEEIKQQLKGRDSRAFYLIEELIDNGGYSERVDYHPVFYPSRRTYIEGRQKNYDIFLRKFLWDYNERKVPWDSLDISDFKKLAWVMKTNKSSYQLGEPIGISVSLQNISTEDVKVLCVSPTEAFFLCSTKVKNRTDWRHLLHLDFEDVSLTEKGTAIYTGGSLYEKRKNMRPESITLKPGEMTEYHPVKTLNLYYDLSEGGEYELAFYTRNFLGSDEEQVGEYPKPCTIRFTIENKMYEPTVEWGDVRSDVEK